MTETYDGIVSSHTPGGVAPVPCADKLYSPRRSKSLSWYTNSIPDSVIAMTRFSLCMALTERALMDSMCTIGDVTVSSMTSSSSSTKIIRRPELESAVVSCTVISGFEGESRGEAGRNASITRSVKTAPEGSKNPLSAYA